MRPPEVYAAISAITAELARGGIPKNHYNLESDYFYRSIDDVLNRLAPLLSAHRLCVLPRVVDRSAIERVGLLDAFLNHVTLKVAFDFISVDDASCHTVEAFGEALDEGDKATAKAMSAAYKSAMLQAFCIPVAGQDDCDRGKLVIKTRHEAEPVQGWEQWSRDVIDIIRACQTEEALTRVQDSNRGLLKAIQRERSDLYSTVGDAFVSCRQSILSPEPETCLPSASARSSKKTSRRGRIPKQEVAHV